MKITVLGSTGATGQEIVRLALSEGHEVIALTRGPAPSREEPRLRVVTGEIDDPWFLQTIIAGVDAVLSALGSHNMRGPTTVYSSSAAAVVRAMLATTVRRFVCVSATPVTPAGQKTSLNRYILDPILRQFFGGGYDDMRRMEEILQASDLNWTVFRPPYLRNAAGRGTYRTAIDAPLSGGFALTRSDLAAAMLASIGDSATFRHTVSIAN